MKKTGSDSPSRHAGEPMSPLRTIVGGRPPESDRLVEGLPSGIQEAILEATVDEDFKAWFLKDPLEAVRKAELVLTDSERAVLAAVPLDQLKVMVERLSAADPGRREFLRRSAVALALAAGTALTVNAGDILAQQTRGISPDLPPTRGIEPDMPPVTKGILNDFPPLHWMHSLDAAVKEMKASGKPLLVVFSSPSASTVAPDSPEGKAEKLCRLEDARLRRLAYRYGFLAAHVNDPARAKEYKVKKFPTVVFLGPVGKKELGRIVQPAAAEALGKAISQAGTEHEKRKDGAVRKKTK